MAFQKPYVPSPLLGKGKAISIKPVPASFRAPVSNQAAQTRSQGTNGGNKPPSKVNTKNKSQSSSSSSSSSSEESTSDFSSSNSKSSKGEKVKDRDNKPPRRGGKKDNSRETYPSGGQRARQGGTEYPGAIKSTLTNPPPKAAKNFLSYEGGDPILFKTDLKSTLTLNEHRGSSYPLALEASPRFHVNIFNCSNPISTGAIPNNFISRYLQTIYQRLSRDVISRARSAVVTAAWTDINFRQYMKDMCNALQIYYTVDSINCTDTRASLGFRDKNVAFQVYQSKFDDPSILKAKNDLANALGNMWFPPKYHKLIAYMYQNYLTSDCEQSLWIRNVPWGQFTYDATVPFSVTNLVTQLGNATNALRTSNNTTISAALSVTYNSGVMTGLYNSSVKPVYDETFLEIFANTPCKFQNNFSADADTIVPFSVFGNVSDLPYYTKRKPEDTDGLAVALHPTYYGTVQAGSNYLGTIDATNTDNSYMFEPLYSLTHTAAGNRASKFAFNSDSDIFTARRDYVANSGTVDSVQIHTLSSAYRACASPQPGWQRAFFVNSEAPRINLGYLMDELFGLAMTSP